MGHRDNKKGRNQKRNTASPVSTTQSPEPPKKSPKEGNASNRIGVIGLVLAGLAILATLGAFVVPEVRRGIHLDPWPTETPAPTPVPTLFPLASEGETLIILGGFDDRSQGAAPSIDVMQKTYDTLVDQINSRGIQAMRVEKLPTSMQITTDAEALTLGQKYKAKLVIWGYKDAGGSSIRTKRMDDPQPGATARSEIEYNATTVPICLREEVPAQGAFLGLFSLGESLIQWDNRQRVELASNLIGAAIASVEQRPLSAQCSRFNPWNAYGLQGHLYGTLAKFFADEKQTGAATDWRKKAIAAYDISISLYRDASWVHSGRGYSQAVLADLLAATDRDQAIKLRQASIDSYTDAMRLEPDDASAYVSRGIRQDELAYLLGATDRDQAIKLHQAAIGSYADAIRLKPDDVSAYFSRGFSQAVLADMLVSTDRDQAIKLRQASIDSNSDAIRLKPDYVDAYVNRGSSQGALADLLAVVDRDQAIKLRLASIDSNSDAIRLKPDYAGSYFNRGFSQAALADLLVSTDRDQAMASWQAAIDSYSSVLRFRPNDYITYLWRGMALAHLDKKEQASADFRKVIELTKDNYYVSRANEELTKLGLKP